MQIIASTIRCASVHRYDARFDFLRYHFPRWGCLRLGFLRCALLCGALGAGIGTQPAGAQVLVRDLQPVSMQFNSAVQDGIRAHQAQVRARQVRVRQARSQAALPRITNNLTMSGDQGNIPLRVRDAPAAPSAIKRIAPSTVGVINSFIRGDLHSDSDNRTASGLSTTA